MSATVSSSGGSRTRESVGQLIDILRSANCCIRDPKHRPSAQEALKHPWLAKGKGKGAGVAQRALGPQLGQVVQRLQQYSQQNAFKKTVLDMMANELLQRHMALLQDVKEEEEEMEVEEVDVQNLDADGAAAAAAGGGGDSGGGNQQAGTAAAAGPAPRGMLTLPQLMAASKLDGSVHKRLGGSMHGRRTTTGSMHGGDSGHAGMGGSLHGAGGSVHGHLEGSLHRAKSMRGAMAAMSALEALRRAREHKSFTTAGGQQQHQQQQQLLREMDGDGEEGEERSRQQQQQQEAGGAQGATNGGIVGGELAVSILWLQNSS